LAELRLPHYQPLLLFIELEFELVLLWLDMSEMVQHINLSILAIEHTVGLVKHILFSNTNFASSFIDSISLMETVNTTDINIISSR
jgi:hypothetical protein